MNNVRRRKSIPRIVGMILLALAGLYLLLLIPERAAPQPKGAGKEPFLWNRDEFWSELETRFRQARALSEAERLSRFDESFAKVQLALDAVAQTNLPPAASAFDELESRFFEFAPIAAVCPARLTDFLSAGEQMRELVKEQSIHWPHDSAEVRSRLYRLLYGRRAAVEEVLLQSPSLTNAVELHAQTNVVSSPGAELHGVQIQSGDILVSRGGAATSALIARGNDFPGNFSHIALVHVDENSKTISVIESHIESGVGVFAIEKYLADTKLRIMVLRLRGDLPQLLADPMLPHKIASFSRSNALSRHIPYDFAMQHDEPSKQFCSEVASSAYRQFGIKLWTRLSHLSAPGVTSWLASLGVRNFESQEPSDLEYDPQLRVVAEWRDPATLFQDHADNAIIDALLENADRGEKLNYNLWMLPIARVAKAWSVLLNQFGGVGPIPEGMSAATALRVKRLTATHASMKARLLEKAQQFQAENGYVPPYWELVRMARESR